MKLRDLRSQSTLRLLLLSLVTCGVYPVHYLLRLTKLLNTKFGQNRRISLAFISVTFVFAYLSLALFIPCILADDGHPVQEISNLVDIISVILILLWSFKVRKRINYLLAATPKKPHWFRGLWTFLFAALYINYKINVLCEYIPEQEID